MFVDRDSGDFVSMHLQPNWSELHNDLEIKILVWKRLVQSQIFFFMLIADWSLFDQSTSGLNFSV